MVVLNLDNSETRRIVENCYRTQKTLINPLIDWDDDFLYWYIRKENIELLQYQMQSVVQYVPESTE